MQAFAVASAIAEARSGARIDGVIVAGDFNLIVTEQPLVTVQRKTELSGPPLTLINALQLDGRSNQTWFNPNIPIAPGHLDYMMYSARTLHLDRAFVFDSRDLSERWLRHYELSEDISIATSDHFPIVADFSW